MLCRHQPAGIGAGVVVTLLKHALILGGGALVYGAIIGWVLLGMWLGGLLANAKSRGLPRWPFAIAITTWGVLTWAAFALADR